MRVTAPSACPACGAALRPDAPWCTLCYADLRPKPEPEPLPEPPPAQHPGIPTQPPHEGPGPTWPCTVCGTANPIARDSCIGCGSGFLAGARSEAPLLDLPVVGDLTKLSRVQRVALAGGVVLAFILLTVLIGLVLG